MHHLFFNDFIIWSCSTTYHFAPTTSLGKQIAFSKQQISCSHQARGDSSIPGHLPPPFSSLTTLASPHNFVRPTKVRIRTLGGRFRAPVVLNQHTRVYLRRWGFWQSATGVEGLSKALRFLSIKHVWPGMSGDVFKFLVPVILRNCLSNIFSFLSLL